MKAGELRANFLAFLADGPAEARAPFYADKPHPDHKTPDAERWPRLAAMWQAEVSRRWGSIIARDLGIVPGAGRVEFDGFAAEAAARYEARSERPTAPIGMGLQDILGAFTNERTDHDT